MVGRFGEVYVMDWGLAKITGRKDLHDIRPRDAEATASLHSVRRAAAGSSPDTSLITMDGSVVGTPAYMPPEQARGQVEEVDQTSDIYSFGAILYSVLTGQAPYAEPGARLSPHTILARVLECPPRRVHLLNPQAPPELIAICEKAMAREKRDRYRSSLELAEDLQAYLDRRVVRAYRTGALAEFKSWVSRNRTTAVLTAGTVFLVMGLFLFGAIWERTKAFRLSESLTRQYLRRGQALWEQGAVARGLHWLVRSLQEVPRQSSALKDTIEQNLAGWCRLWRPPKAMLLQDSLVYAAALTPDGKRAITGNHSGVVRLWSVETGRQVGTSLEHPNMVEDVAFSPDGGLLATACGDGKARFWSVRTGRQIGPDMAHRGSVLAVDFSPDGRQIVTGSRDRTARFWSVPAGRPAGMILEHGHWVEDLCFSRDGKRLATTADVVTIWSAETGEPLGPPVEQSAKMWEVAFSPDGTCIAAAADGNRAHLWTLPPLLRGGLRYAELWVEVLTWQEMDPKGVLTWLDRASWEARRAELEKLGKPSGK